MLIYYWQKFYCKTLPLIDMRLTIIEVRLKMKIFTNDSIIVVYLIFLTRLEAP